MTRRATIAALLRREIPDRMGINEHFWPYLFENAWHGQGLPKDADVVKFFDLDIACVDWYSPPGPRPDLATEITQDEETITSRSAWGEELRLWKKRGGTPEHVGFTITSPDIWFRDFRDAFIAQKPGEGVDFAAIRARKESYQADDRFVTYSFMHIFEWMRKVLGDVTMLESLLVEKEFVHDFCTAVTDHFLGYYDRLFREAGLPDGIHVYDDLGYTAAPFCSPQCHCEMVLPYHRKMFALFREKNIPIILHTCGDFRPHLPAIVESGVCCIQALEAKTGMDVRDLAKDWKKDLCFMGNLDVRAYESGNRALITEEVVGKMEYLKAMRAPFIVMSDHSISPGVALADYQFSLELYRRHCKY